MEYLTLPYQLLLSLTPGFYRWLSFSHSQPLFQTLAVGARPSPPFDSTMISPFLFQRFIGLSRLVACSLSIHGGFTSFDRVAALALFLHVPVALDERDRNSFTWGLNLCLVIAASG